MYFPADDFRISVVYPMEFDAVRVYGSTLHPATFELKVALTPAHFEKRTSKVIEEKSEEGLQRLSFWRDTILDGIAIVDVSSEVFGDLAASIDNTIMFCPGPPTDHLLAELLTAKISTILKGFFDIHAITLSSSDTHNIETSFRSIHGYVLPDISYFPQEAMHSMPWWERDTIEVCEFAKGAILEDELFNHFSDYFGKKEADIIIFRADGKDEDGQV